MKHQDEHGQTIDTRALAAEIEADDMPAPSAEELESELTAVSRSRGTSSAAGVEAASVGGFLQKIRKEVCKIINGSSTTEEILERCA